MQSGELCRLLMSAAYCIHVVNGGLEPAENCDDFVINSRYEVYFNEVAIAIALCSYARAIYVEDKVC